jgi:hypothetical protein
MDNALNPAEVGVMPIAGRERPSHTTARTITPPKAPTLRPEGHNAFWEGARPWLVFLGATALTIIGTYVIAEDSIKRFFGGTGSFTDVLVMAVSVGVGLLLDAAIVISGMRTQQERGFWRVLSTAMFITCIGVEAMTLAYFYKIIQPESVPVGVGDIIDGIHNLLYFFRAGLPPLIVAFFGVAVRNLVFTQADRKRKMMEATGLRLLGLEERLADPTNTENKATLVLEYETQLRLFEYASDAKPEEKAANTSIIAEFKRIWNVGTSNAENTIRAEIERARQQFDLDMQHLQQLFVRSLLFLVANGRPPDEALALAPELAEIDWSRFTSTKAGKAAPKSGPKTQTASGEIAEMLADLGIDTVAKPFETSKDIWVKTEAIEALSGGAVTGQAKTKLAKELSQKPGKSDENYKLGLSYIVPVRKLIAALAERNQLVLPVLTWYKARAKGGESEQDTGELALAIDEA